VGLTARKTCGKPDVCFESLISDIYWLPLQLQTKSECKLRLDEEALLQYLAFFACVFCHFLHVLIASVRLGLVFSVLSQDIGDKERVQSDLFCVEWNVWMCGLC